MSEPVHPGLHPDPDSLSAFVEGVLPEHERLECLAHLAGCSRCREIVFLAQAPQPVPIPRRWLRPVPILSAAAALVIMVAASVYFQRQPAEVARHTPASTPPQIAEAPQTTAPPPPAARKRAVRRAAPQPPEPSPVPVEIVQAPLPPPPVVTTTPPTSEDGLAGITGTVTDPSGAAISGSSVTLRQVDGTARAETRTNAAGQFQLKGLPAGRYELQIAVAGFRNSVRQIDLEPQRLATVATQMEIGSVSETVTITADAPALSTSSSSVEVAPRGREPRPLPSKLPVDLRVENGNRVLAADSAGALFISRNRGRRWKAVKPVWKGRVVDLEVVSDPNLTPIAAFALTTESDAVWLSRDGEHWFPAPPPR